MTLVADTVLRFFWSVFVLVLASVSDILNGLPGGLRSCNNELVNHAVVPGHSASANCWNSFAMVAY